MPKFTPEALRKVMDNRTNIRNISIIAHVDHGKTTLTDSLVAPCGIIRMDQAGDTCLMDTMDLEKQMGITIKCTGISLHFDMTGNRLLPKDYSSQEFIVNLVDSPGHVDFSSEVTAALRVTDGALVIVDCVEGVCVQTETVLRQALTERIKPVLCINKLDRGFLELQYTPEQMYQNFVRILDSVNSSISTFSDEVMGDLLVSPEKGNVAFCAGKLATAFTLQTFAKHYAPRVKMTEAKLMEKFWGENYWDPETKEWLTSPVSPSGKKLSRAFCQFVLEPLKDIFDFAMKNQKEELEARLAKIGVVLSHEEKEKKDKALLKAVLQKWMPAHEAILEMVVLHLPSPVQAQQYRVETLYEGPLDDPVAQAIRQCDPNGPVMIFISKMVYERNRFWAFGRVFSGTARTGAKVRVLNANYDVHSKEVVPSKTIQRTLIMMGKVTHAVDDVPCGNTIGIVGVDDAILKTATLTDYEGAFPLKQLKYSVSPVVRAAVSPDCPANLLKLLEGLKKLSKIEPLVHVSLSETGEHVIAAAGELHLQICLHQLRELSGLPELKTSDPIVNFKETVTSPSSITCLAKSANKHNRLYMKAEPLGEALSLAIEEGRVGAQQDPKARSKLLTSDFGWEPDSGKKIWCFGPNRSGPNMVVDVTKGQQQIAEIQDHVVAAFQWFSESGALVEEEVRGVRFNVLDAHLHADAIHRGAGQIIPTARRAFCAAQLTAEPRLQEPIFLVEVQCPMGAVVGSTHSVLSRRRGYIIEEMPRPGTQLCTLKAHLPVMESFGFISELRAATSGQAFPTLVFDHWALLEESPFVEGKVKQMIAEIRKRKGLSLEIPPLEKYLDKL